MTFSEAEKTKVGLADSEAKLGINALYRGDWAKAQRHCGVALRTFKELGLPRTATTVPFFSQVESCLADAYANLGDMDEACRLYRWTGYQTHRARNPKAMCDKYTAAAEAKAAAAEADGVINNDYTRTYNGFMRRMYAMAPMPRGSGRQAKVGELVADCDTLRGYGQRLPQAYATASYCSAIVAFERGNDEQACELMWTGARQIRTALAGQLRPVQRTHANEMQETIDHFSPVCASSGYRWPDFSAVWPH